MSHLDEGTIHAWLDGALPADETARVEAHARDCAQCSAAIAEARGFIAGASRIVSSLDVVRGDVIPAAVGAPAKSTPRGSLWRALKFTPARAAIAATLLIGVASMLTLRHQDLNVASPPARVAADTTAAMVSPPPVAPTNAPVANQVQAARVAPKQLRPEVAASSPAAPSSPSSPSSRDVPVPAGALDAAKSRVATADTVPAVAEPAPAPAPARRAFRDSTLRLMEVVVTGASEAVRRDSSAAARANSSSARASSSGAAARDAAGGIARGAAGATSQAAIEASVPGCYRLQVDPPTDLRGFPAQFRLVRDSTTGGHPVYAVNADRDSVLNGAGWQVLQGRMVLVAGTDARFGSVEISFAADSTRATVRSTGGTGVATIQRVSCTR